MQTKTNTEDATDDAIDINVRGRIFTTLRSTLLSQGGMLASMLSESWAQWDPSERIFLNLNPNHFCSMLDDILLAQWGACGDQSVAYFAFLDFLGLLQPVEEKNYLLAGRAYNHTSAYDHQQQSYLGGVCGYVNQASIIDRIQTWGVKIWSGFSGTFDKIHHNFSRRRNDYLVPLPFFGVLITGQTTTLTDFFHQNRDTDGALMPIKIKSPRGMMHPEGYTINGEHDEPHTLNHQMIGWSNEDLLCLNGASMHNLQQGDLIYMQLDPQKGILRMRCQRFGVHVLEKRVPQGQCYHVFIGLDMNMCAELTPIDWYKRVLPGVEI